MRAAKCPATAAAVSSALESVGTPSEEVTDTERPLAVGRSAATFASSIAHGGSCDRGTAVGAGTRGAAPVLGTGGRRSRRLPSASTRPHAGHRNTPNVSSTISFV